MAKKVNMYYEEQNILALDSLMMDLVDEETGEIKEVEEFEKLEREIETRIQYKLDTSIKQIREEEAKIEAINSEIERLTKRANTKKEAVDRIKTIVLRFMVNTGKKELDGALGTFKVSKSSAVIVSDFGKIPKKYVKTTVKETVSPDKKALRKAIDSGEKVDGAYIEYRDNLKLK